MSHKANETMSLQERFAAQMNLASKVEEDLLAKMTQVSSSCNDHVYDIYLTSLTSKQVQYHQ